MSFSHQQQNRPADHQGDATSHKKAVPSRSRRKKWTRASRTAASRKRAAAIGKAGLHRRRNKRVQW